MAPPNGPRHYNSTVNAFLEPSFEAPRNIGPATANLQRTSLKLQLPCRGIVATLFFSLSQRPLFQTLCTDCTTPGTAAVESGRPRWRWPRDDDATVGWLNVAGLSVKGVVHGSRVGNGGCM